VGPSHAPGAGRGRRAALGPPRPGRATPGRTVPRPGKGRRGAREKGGRGLTVGGEAGIEVEEGETSCTGKKETCARGRGGREIKREAVWGGGGADRRAPLGVAAAVSTARCARGLGGHGGALGRVPARPRAG
jgi:hypothetical protein